MSKPACQFVDCKRPCYGNKDLCKSHYQQGWRGQELKSLRVSPTTPLSERIASWKKLATTNEKGCWIWHKYINPDNGYGEAGFNGKNHKVHKLVWEFFNGPVPESKELDHLCRVRECWNPEHLEPVTHLENVRRGVGHGKETHCPAQHPYDELNTYHNPNGQRACRTCRREGMQRARERKKAA